MPVTPPKTIIFVRASTPNIAVTLFIYIIKYISVPTANSIFIIDGGAGVYVRHPLNICRCQNQLVVAKAKRLFFGFTLGVSLCTGVVEGLGT